MTGRNRYILATLKGYHHRRAALVLPALRQTGGSSRTNCRDAPAILS